MRTEDRLLDFYIDETSQTKHRYLIIGGLIVDNSSVGFLTEQLKCARIPDLPAGELGWTKVSRTKLEAYRRFIDIFFDWDKNNGVLDFHSLVVDTSKLNDHRFNSGSREIGFNKDIYQLGMKASRLYRDAYFHIYPDKRETKSSTEELRLILNRGIAKTGDRRDWAVRRLHFRESSLTLPLQLADVLLGSIAFVINDHRSAINASPAKTDLSDYILSKAGVRNPRVDTAISGKFTIWHRRLK